MVEKLIKLCENIPPDFEEIENIIKLVDDVNAVVDEENILSEIILNTEYKNGQNLPKIIRLFLENGFDVTKNNGSAGAKCLQNLTWSSYDDYILEAAKILLDAGADPNGIPNIEEPEEWHESVISWVGTKCSGEIITGYDDDDLNGFESSNRFCTMYDIMDAAIEGIDYSDIQSCYFCIGKRIDSISVCSPEDQTDNVLFDEHGCYLYSPLIINCEGVPLCLNDKREELFVNALIYKKNQNTNIIDKSIFDISIGQKITDIKFEYQNSTSGAISILLDNNITIKAVYDEGTRNGAFVQVINN